MPYMQRPLKQRNWVNRLVPMRWVAKAVGAAKRTLLKAQSEGENRAWTCRTSWTTRIIREYTGTYRVVS